MSHFNARHFAARHFQPSHFGGAGNPIIPDDRNTIGDVSDCVHAGNSLLNRSFSVTAGDCSHTSTTQRATAVTIGSSGNRGVGGSSLGAQTGAGKPLAATAPGGHADPAVTVSTAGSRAATVDAETCGHEADPLGDESGTGRPPNP